MDDRTIRRGGPVARRVFLKGAGAGAVVAATGFPDWLLGQVVRASLVEVDGVLTATIHRAADQAWLRFEFEQVVFDTAGDGTAVLRPTGPGAVMRLRYPAQHVAEATIAPGTTPGTQPIAHRVAGESRLVVPITGAVAFTAAALTALLDAPLQSDPRVGDPGPASSMLELPADLRSIPGTDTVVRVDPDPITHDGITQLHRTVLGTAARPASIRPVFNAASADSPASRVPDANGRDDLVAAASAAPATASRLWLTLHGAWAEIEGQWASTTWIHSMTGGRDLFVQVTRRGHLLPFGVPAVWVTTASRVWAADNRSGTVAVMVSEEYVTVADGTIEFFDPGGDGFDPGAPDPGAPGQGRRMPFRSITVEPRPATRATKGTVSWTGGSLPTGDAWTVHETVFGARMPQSYLAGDAAGNEPVTVSLPMVFVPEDRLAAATSGLASFYADPVNAVYGSASLRDDLAWAPEVTAGSRLTTLYTTRIHLGVAPNPTAGRLPVAPVVTGGSVRAPGDGSSPPRTVDVTLADRWIDEGLDAVKNPDLAFVALVEPIDLPLGVEARAVMTPDVTAEVFNQTLGFGANPFDAVDPLTGLEVPTWRPQDAFGSAAAVLGRFLLDSLVKPVSLADAIPGIDVPALSTLALPPNLPTELRTVQEWCPERIESIPALGFVADEDTSLCVRLEAVVALDPTVMPRAVVEFAVRDFTLQVPPLVNVVELDVAVLRVVQPSDGPVDLTFDVSDWRIGDALSWLTPLFDLLSPAGSDFDVGVVDGAIDTDLSLPMPDVNLGILKIRNLGVDLALSFPFLDDRPALVSVDVGRPSAPISIQLAKFKGSFFTRLRFSPAGLELVRVRAEVSAQLFSIDIKVATAYLEVGIAAEFVLRNGEVTFIGELWLEASFSALGVINATLRIAGRVTYLPAQERLKLSGTITWSVSALFTASGSVEIGTLTFDLGGSGSGAAALGGGVGPMAMRSAPRLGHGSTSTGPPTGFGDQHTLATWSEYVSKFAA